MILQLKTEFCAGVGYKKVLENDAAAKAYFTQTDSLCLCKIHPPVIQPI